MPRWRQVWNEAEGKSEFIPLDEAAAKMSSGVAIHGPMEPFVSPLDGTVISDRKQYRDHMKKHGVVPAAEFSPEFYEKKAQERAKHYKGERSKEEIRRDRMAMNEIINRLQG